MRNLLIAAVIATSSMSMHVPAADAGVWDFVKCSFGRWTDAMNANLDRFGNLLGSQVNNALWSFNPGYFGALAGRCVL